ncbi:hypothetical protein M407DRAFT_9788 [Tulasnella calospora MUT 4182]|uniref:Ubiquitin carboxyl-terminal hydrolase n=1 Tax=Tulasnella calospora MUT 4182 TaxID=1051891 RepID=A0A0C3KMX5_9AGAM|nr:hypothetical protein M407DRAFT_9788 [Tulasnella calospora MUT 4182]
MASLELLTDEGVAASFSAFNNNRSMRRVDFSRNHSLSGAALSALLAHFGAVLEDLNINSWKETPNETLMGMAQYLPQLVNLDMSWCREVDDYVIKSVLDGCPMLKSVKCHGCNRVTVNCPRKSSRASLAFGARSLSILTTTKYGHLLSLRSPLITTDTQTLPISSSRGIDDRHHARTHYERSNHPFVLNVKRKAKPRPQRDDNEPPMKKLAIQEEREEDKYTHETTLKCWACGGVELPDLANEPKVRALVDGVMQSMSSARQSEVKAWEEDITACEHTLMLEQISSHQTAASGLAQCGKCDLKENLWLCLTCGNLGCGRAQFGGVGGNSHGLAHFNETQHPASVKLGTITAEGTADPELAAHLANFGINVLTQTKTEKSMTELQIEHNLNFDFSMTGDDGKSLEPVFGAGLTGLANLGNSCYMASVIQSLFSLPAFQTRFYPTSLAHAATCPEPLPASCLECQMGKLADGLLSGRYSHPRKVPDPSAVVHSPSPDAPDHTAPQFQEGLKPTMFKALIGKGHEEFSTMRQQDSEDLDAFIGLGKQEGEVELPEEAAAAPAMPQINEAAMGQLQAMGFGTNACQRALLATGNSDAEQAMNWLFQHMEDPDLNDPPVIAPAAKSGPEPSADDIAGLSDMGFTPAQARKALRETGGSMERAVEWLFSHPDDAGEEAGASSTGPAAAASSHPGGSNALPARYHLKAFISHKGPSVHSGHYVAHIKTEKEGWVLFNDEKVVRASSDNLKDLKPLAYLYIFEKEVVIEEMTENKARKGMETMPFEVEGTIAPEAVSLANMEMMGEEDVSQKTGHLVQEG